MFICLFGPRKPTKNNTDLDKYGYGGYGIGFYARSNFHCQTVVGGKNVIFGSDIGSPVHVCEFGESESLGENPTRGSDDTTVISQAKHPINFTQPGKGLHYNERNSF